MTAPLRAGEPVIVNVALGSRAYDIVIGRGLLAELGARIAALKPGAAAAIVTDETVARHHLKAAEASLADAGMRATSILVPPGEGSKSWRMLETRLRPAARCPHRAQRRGGGARRRRGRRSLRACGRAAAPRPRCGAGADHLAGAGRFLGRRQDRDQFPPRQEPGRRVPSADPGDRRHRAARHAARRATSAPAMRRSRNSACSAMPASSPGWRRTGRTCSRAAALRKFCARARDRHCVPRQGRDRGARRARDRRPRAAQSRPHLRACVRGGGRLLRQAAARRGGRARHRAARSNSRPGSACWRRTRPGASRIILRPSGCRPTSARCRRCRPMRTP